jgi:peptidyl-prolyl cis-trans isomerase SurA
MKSRQLVYILFILFLPGFLSAQDLNDKVLLTIDKRDVSAGEFIRMYKKSYEPGNLKDLDGYLNQFIIFKQKVSEAIHEGYDTTRSFRTELEGYRNQLAQNFLTDKEVKERLLKQAYQRYLSEINAWHILIACPAEANPDDTLKAWKKAKNVRERIIMGEPFEQVARSSSDDPSVKVNGGNLGYFTAFQMIMPFEDAAYNLKKGEISEPVRTPYGYHIIKVTDKRPSGGKIKVAHIMKTVPPGTSEKDAKAIESEINTIYWLVVGGTPFGELAAKYSDHKETASKGGELNWFGAGEIISDFAEAAFSISKNGDFTKPVRTVYGWHIIKRLDKKAPGTFEETRSYLESKINESYLNSLSKKSFIEKLKKEYKYRLNVNAFNWFVANTDTMIIKGLLKYNRKEMPSGTLYTFANQQLTTREFAGYIERRGSMIVTNDPEYFIKRSVETIVSDQIFNYENSMLEKKYPEFRYLMNEFHDGILLFEISGKKVWNKSQEDSTGLMKYYEDNKNNYLTKSGIEAKIYTLNKRDGMKQLSSAYRKFKKYEDADIRLIKKFISGGDSLLKITRGTWMKGDDRDIDTLKFVTGIQETTFKGFPSIVSVERIIEPKPLAFSEVQGEMITGYQDWLEKNWIKQLKDKFSVKINSDIMEEIRKKLGNE